jgi:hypothetical protein
MIVNQVTAKVSFATMEFICDKKKRTNAESKMESNEFVE